MTQTTPRLNRHILHVIDSMDPAAGGPTEAIRALFEFAPPGCTGEVVTLDRSGAPFLQHFPFPIHALRVFPAVHPCAIPAPFPVG